MPKESTPFKILALAPFKTTGGKPWGQGPLQVDRDNISHVMEDLGIALYIHLSQDISPAGGTDLHISTPKDLHPDGLMKSCDLLKNFAEAGKFIEQAGAEGLSADRIEAGLKRFTGIPPIRVEPPEKKKTKSAASAIDSLLDMVALPGENDASPPSYSKPSAQIQAAIKRVFHAIFSDGDFRRIEAAWRGVALILDQGGMGDGVTLDIVPVDMDTLEDSMSALIPELVQDLPSLIVVDLPFDNTARSMELLEAVAGFSETLLVPSVAWINHRFFHLDSWDDLKKLSFLPHLLDEPNWAKWRTLRGSSKAHWLTVACNRFLTRYPFGPENRPRAVDFTEPEIPWTSPVWAFAALMGQSAARFGWPTRLNDWSEIRLQDMALYSKDGKNPIATELFLTEDRIQQLLRCGITPLVGQRRQDVAFVPAETTAAGDSLAYQVFLTRVTQFVLRLHDDISRSLEPRELEQSLTRALTRLFEEAGQMGAESIDVSAGAPDEENRTPVHISIKPKRRVLTSGRKVELDILW